MRFALRLDTPTNPLIPRLVRLLTAVTLLVASAGYADAAPKTTTSQVKKQAPAKKPATTGVFDGPMVALRIGGAAPVGSNADEFDVGFRFGVQAGYRFQIGTHAGLTPILQLDHRHIPGQESDIDNLTFTVGARYDYYIPLAGRHLVLWFGGAVGYGSVTQTFSGRGGEVEVGGDGLAVATTLGANFQILPWLAAGVFVQGSKTVVDELEDTQYGTFSIDFGLTVEARLP